MVLPTDRGIVFIEDGRDGTQTAVVCAEVVDGRPRRAYATHFKAQVVVAPDVGMTVHGSSRHTTDIAEVFSDEAGVVHVRRPR